MSPENTALTESCDAIVVGARCAGSATAIALARGGRKVIALDRSKFPSDTLSTHLLFPAGVAELSYLAALDRILALDPPKIPEIVVTVESELEARERFTAVDGIDYGLCVPRTQLDMALVETARDQGVEVRERCSVKDVIWHEGRAAGVRYTDAEGVERELRAKLVVGADGRRSTMASLLGAEQPYRASRNGRGLVFRYMDDPQAGTRWGHTMSQFRAGDTHGMAFPCPDDRMLVLFMGPAEEVREFRRDPEGTWERKVALNPSLARRVAGATNATKIRSTPDVPAFFRASSGPGWALVGDAGHFKDPVIAQGIRDAVRFGRLLGEQAAPHLHDPRALDQALLRAERRRDRECQGTYHWGNRESRAVPSSSLVVEALRQFASTTDPGFSDAFNRTRNPDRVLHLGVGAKALLRAAARPGADRRGLVREVVEELRIDFDIHRERRRDAFRSTRMTRSERAFQWPVSTDPPETASRSRQPAAAGASA